MNNKKNFKKILLNNHKGVAKNLEHLFLNARNINLNYIKKNEVLKTHKSKYWHFNSSSHLNYSSLFSSGGEIVINTLIKNGYECINLLCASGPKFCQSGVSIKNFNSFMPCLACYSFNKKGGGNYIEFKNNNLKTDKKAEIKNLEEIIQPSLNWILRGDVQSPLANDLKNKMIKASNKWFEFLLSIDKNHLPENIILFNGVSFPECIIKYFMEKNNVNVITYESGYAENSIHFSNSSATDYEFNFDKNKELNTTEKNKLYEYFGNRTSGEFTRSGVRFWNNPSKINKDLKTRINKFNKNVTIFLNVPFDTSQVKASYLFEDMYDWIDSLIDFASYKKDIHFIFRAHPDEVREDKEIFSETSTYILEKVRKYNNISVISARENDSSYELIDISDLILTYNSTIGLEAALMKTNVIAAGYSHISRINYFEIFNDKHSYFDNVQETLKLKNFNGDSFTKEIETYFYQMIFNSSIDFSGVIQKESAVYLNKYKHKIKDEVDFDEITSLQLEKNIISELKKLSI